MSEELMEDYVAPFVNLLEGDIDEVRVRFFPVYSSNRF